MELVVISFVFFKKMTLFLLLSQLEILCDIQGVREVTITEKKDKD